VFVEQEGQSGKGEPTKASKSGHLMRKAEKSARKKGGETWGTPGALEKKWWGGSAQSKPVKRKTSTEEGENGNRDNPSDPLASKESGEDGTKRRKK